MSFDSKCFDLAKTFLSDSPAFRDLGMGSQKLKVDQLAQEIQDTIENFCEAEGFPA